MPYKSKEDFPPSLKGFDPPLSVEQAEGIARCADNIEGVESPWGVCISSFKKAYKKEGSQWVKKSAEGKESDMGNLDYGYGLAEAQADEPGSGMTRKAVSKAIGLLEEGDKDAALAVLQQCRDGWEK